MALHGLFGHWLDSSSSVLLLLCYLYGMTAVVVDRFFYVGEETSQGSVLQF